MVSGFDFKRLGVFVVSWGMACGLLSLAPFRWAHAVDPQNAGGAQVAGGGPDPTQPWHNPNDPTCSQGCTYQKANENILILISYHKQRLELAEQKSKQDLLDFLGSYCVAEERKGSDATLEKRASDCLERYRRTETVALGKMRADLLNNEDHQAKLRSTVVYEAQGDSGKAGPATALLLPSESVAKELNAKQPGGLYFFTLRDLEKRYELDIESARERITERFNNWTQEIRKPPAREEFAKVKKILREPGNPGAGTLSIYETGPDGKIVIDEAAYTSAIRAFTDDGKQVDADAKKYTDNRREYTDHRRISTKLKKAALGSSLQLFKQVRDGTVDSLNGEIQKGPRAKPTPSVASKTERSLAQTGGTSLPTPAPLPSPPSLTQTIQYKDPGLGAGSGANDPEAGNHAIKPTANTSINLEVDLARMGKKQRDRYDKVFIPRSPRPPRAPAQQDPGTPSPADSSGASSPKDSTTSSGGDTSPSSIEPPYISGSPN